MVRPSGEKASAATVPDPPCQALINWPDAVFHSLTVGSASESSLPVATVWPSGAKASDHASSL